MKDIKKFLIAALSFMLLFSVSCSNDNKTGGGGKGNGGSGGSDTETIYNVVGDWYGDDSGSGTGERKMITIKDDFSGVYYKDASDTTGTTIPADSIKNNGNNTYTATITIDTVPVEGTLKFTSDTTGTAKLGGSETKITKK